MEKSVATLYVCVIMIYNKITNVNINEVMLLNKYDKIGDIIKDNNGYLFISDGEKAGISRTYLLQYIRENNLEHVSKGVYVTEDTWPDMLYVTQRSNPKIIFSNETALFLNGLMEREYTDINVSVTTGHNGSRLREKGIIVHQEKYGIYGLGVCDLKTNYGNTVIVYNSERCICDLIKNRAVYDMQIFQTAIKSYMKRKNKDLSLMLSYAEKIKVKEEVMKYVEVLV